VRKSACTWLRYARSLRKCPPLQETSAARAASMSIRFFIHAKVRIFRQTGHLVQEFWLNPGRNRGSKRIVSFTGNKTSRKEHFGPFLSFTGYYFSRKEQRWA
jgi:hypothetical protein